MINSFFHHFSPLLPNIRFHVLSVLILSSDPLLFKLHQRHTDLSCFYIATDHILTVSQRPVKWTKSPSCEKWARFQSMYLYVCLITQTMLKKEFKNKGSQTVNMCELYVCVQTFMYNSYGGKPGRLAVQKMCQEYEWTLFSLDCHMQQCAAVTLELQLVVLTCTINSPLFTEVLCNFIVSCCIYGHTDNSSSQGSRSLLNIFLSVEVWGVLMRVKERDRVCVCVCTPCYPVSFLTLSSVWGFKAYIRHL